VFFLQNGIFTFILITTICSILLGVFYRRSLLFTLKSIGTLFVVIISIMTIVCILLSYSGLFNYIGDVINVKKQPINMLELFLCVYLIPIGLSLIFFFMLRDRLK